eukprot:gnl/TRDRNA2_/TRDRNA2_75832_c0_seq2.p1 gnl/TRDRNA2_/TRDRNA2_75832_c0~~gnl/TRDRNA2_/TRDRNA2_75832_c0_seq2.p1  ORF type:complete len:101 (+),score=4.32 gnl/TRDRNA2_/TRDRNA2_75832_c0_seq2:48-305(+)
MAPDHSLCFIADVLAFEMFAISCPHGSFPSRVSSTASTEAWLIFAFRGPSSHSASLMAVDIPTRLCSTCIKIILFHFISVGGHSS